MENYDKWLTSKDVPEIVKDAIRASIEARRTEAAIMDYYRPIVEQQLKSATTYDDILAIKESLRVIHPDLLCKTLLFYMIITKQEELGF